MDLVEAAAEITKFSYKPGWEFAIFVDPDYVSLRDGWQLRLVAQVEDSRSGKRPAKISFVMVEFVNPDSVTTELLHLHLIRLIRRAEEHEQHEWLRYNGELLKDPHKEGST